MNLPILLIICLIIILMIIFCRKEYFDTDTVIQELTSMFNNSSLTTNNINTSVVEIEGNLDNIRIQGKGLTSYVVDWFNSNMLTLSKQMAQMGHGLVRIDNKYGIQSGLGGFLSDQGGWPPNLPTKDTDLQVLEFVKESY